MVHGKEFGAKPPSSDHLLEDFFFDMYMLISEGCMWKSVTIGKLVCAYIIIEKPLMDLPPTPSSLERETFTLETVADARS